MYQPTIEVGDLVYHLMHGKSWIALVLNTTLVEERCTPNKLCREYVVVHMQSGTDYEFYFKNASRATKLSDSCGLICYHWLRKMSDAPTFI